MRERILDLTAGRGADASCNPVGGELFDVSLRAIVPLGRILVIGWIAAGRFSPHIQRRFAFARASRRRRRWRAPDRRQMRHHHAGRVAAAGHLPARWLPSAYSPCPSSLDFQCRAGCCFGQIAPYIGCPPTRHAGAGELCGPCLRRRSEDGAGLPVTRAGAGARRLPAAYPMVRASLRSVCRATAVIWPERKVMPACRSVGPWPMTGADGINNAGPQSPDPSRS